MLQIKIKKLHENAVIPCYASHGDAGMDLTATSREFIEDILTYGTGLAIEIPEGYVGLIFPRSSIYKQQLVLANSIGVIDSGYRGEIMCKFRKTADFPDMYAIGDRVAQIVILPFPRIEMVEVDELSDTSRGNGGFGSTGK